MTQTITWILVADRYHAQLLVRRTYRNMAFHSKGLGLAPVHTPILLRKCCEMHFIREIADVLNQCRMKRLYHRIVLIAPHPIIGHLKKYLYKTVILSIKAELGS